MNQPLNLEVLTEEIRTLYRSQPGQARVAVEKLLELKLKELSLQERLTLLGQLKDRFRPADSPVVRSELDSPPILELISLILGRRVTGEELDSKEVLNGLSQSLNTVFNSLNDLILVIQSTLGRSSEVETIRSFIVSHLGEGKQLEAYLNQIKEAFLVAHRAFEEATRVKFQQALEELDPNAIEASSEGGLKIGPLRRAEHFDIYKARFQRVSRWFNSERFSEELTREFEKICQRIYANKGGHDEKPF